VAKAHHKGRRDRKPSEFQEEVLSIDRVTRVVSGGRRLRFRATVVLGNKKGKVGLGVGKANEVISAIQKAIAKAKKNMIHVKSKNGTIPHQVRHKFKSAKLLLMPAAEGTGIIAGGTTRKIVELAGIKNILTKSFGTSNKIASARATIEALQQFSMKVEDEPMKKEEKKAPAKKPAAKKPAAKKPAAKAAPKKEAAKKPAAKKPAAKKAE